MEKKDKHRRTTSSDDSHQEVSKDGQLKKDGPPSSGALKAEDKNKPRLGVSLKTSFSNLKKMMIGDKKDHKEEPQHYPVISGPTDVKREMHIGFNPQTGKFEGLPPEWNAMLGASGIKQEEVAKSPDTVLQVLKFQQRMQAQQGKAPEPLPAVSGIEEYEEEEKQKT